MDSAINGIIGSNVKGKEWTSVCKYLYCCYLTVYLLCLQSFFFLFWESTVVTLFESMVKREKGEVRKLINLKPAVYYGKQRMEM